MHSLAMSAGNNALVLKEFSINNEGPEYVHIVARKAGLISWFLTLVGIDATTTFRVYAERIEFEEGTLSGKLNTTIPLSSISITSCGYTKPFVLLVLMVVAILAALPTFGLSLILAIIFFIFYKLNKALLISVVTNSSWPANICFKRSVIEGVNVDYEQAQEVINTINQLIMNQTTK
jgi:hypothetical protein